MALLQNEDIEVKESQYYEKNQILREFGEQVDKWTFYEDVFEDTGKIIPVVVSANEHMQAMSIDSAIDFSTPRDDVYVSGCTYFHNWYSKKTAHDIYAFIIDLDSVWSGGLLNGLRCDWQLEGVPTHYAKPTYIVNSGTGLHLYFVLKEPVPCFGTQLQEIEELYRKIAMQQSAKSWIGQKPQIQWFGQSFRMVGSLTKDGFETTAFRYGEKWDIHELAKWYGIEKKFRKRGEHEYVKPVRRKKPILKNGKREGFTCHKGFYEYTLRNIREKTREGNRYMSMCALAVVAWKCDVDKYILEKDLESLLPNFNKGAVRTVKATEIKSAMKMHNPRAMQTTRERLEDWLGWNYEGVQRNGRTRQEHLHAEYWINEKGRPIANTCKLNRDLALKFLRDNGEIHGRPNKERIVADYIKKHPNAKVSVIARECGISRNTVYKYINNG